MLHALINKFVPCSEIKILGKLDDDTLIKTTFILNKNTSQHTIKEILSECNKFGLTASYELFSIKIDGTTENFNKFLKTELYQFSKNDKVFHSHNANILIPHKWKNDIIDIFGLNTYPIATPYTRFINNGVLSSRSTSNTPSTFTSTQVANLYNFPKNLDGTGQKIAIISLGGGYNISDIKTYLSNAGINLIPNIIDISVDGAKNDIYSNPTANGENILDIEVPIAIVPKAEFRVYFAPNTFQGFYNAIKRGIDDRCNIISISWGAAESLWPKKTMESFNSLFQSAIKKNITIIAAAGDNGSSDRTSTNNVDFPSSSPYVLACGGTRLIADNLLISSETIWNNDPSSSATGGGISNYFLKPDYQSNISVVKNKRGVPDIAGNADPSTGYIVYMDGRNLTIGGTSAVAPLLSALIAQINQSTNRSIGFIHPIIYSNPSAFRDIVQGNNGAYSASTGWDACSGNGSPDGMKILDLFKKQNTLISLPIKTIPMKTIVILVPKANFDTKINGLEIDFIDKSSDDPTFWSWNFGDGTISLDVNPKHQYKTYGTYNVSLIVSNSTGPNKITKTINMQSSTNNTELMANFSTNRNVLQPGSSAKFTDLSNNSNIIEWNWDFGDGFTNFTHQNPYHRYNTRGIYDVKLTVKTNSGESNTITKKNLVTIR